MEKNMWSLQLAANGAVDLYIYGDVEGDSYDWWNDEVIKSETSANHFREELSKYSNADINIYINSFGGSVFEGMAIYNQLKRHNGKKTVYVDGFACSIASVIACAGDEVIVPANSLMMIHNPWMCVAGNAAEMRKAAEELEIVAKAARAAYLNKAGDKLNEDELIEMMDKETWLTGEDCVRLGLADRISDKAIDMNTAQEMLKKANLNLEQSLKVRQSLKAQMENLNEFMQDEKVQKEVKKPTLFETIAGLNYTQK